MRFVRTLPFLCALALLAWSSNGCSKRESAEAQQQRNDMMQEHQTWRAEMQNWDNAHSQLRAVLTAPPAKGTKPDTAKVSEEMAKLQKHEDDVAQFRQSLDDLDQKIQNYKEHEPAMLWAEHMKLKAQYEMLQHAHNDLAQSAGSPAADTTRARSY
jgi:hypothetical protein